MNYRPLFLAIALLIIVYQTILQRASHAERDLQPQFCIWNDAVVLGDAKSTDLVTFVTHASVQYLRNLNELLRYWSAPISVAIYVHDAQHVPIVAQALRTLTVDNTFVATIFWRRKHATDSCAVPISSDDCDDWHCLPTENDVDLTYPVNMARNIARARVQTPYELVADVELQPASLDFTHRLEEFLRTVETPSTTVHVVPVFEYNTTIQMPANKIELLKAIYSRKAVFFHHFKAPECHRIPDAAKWLQRPDDGAVSVFTTTRWLQPCWEPVYVARAHQTPLYNESFVGYGKNKIQQVRFSALKTMRYINSAGLRDVPRQLHI